MTREIYKASIPETVITTMTSDLFTADQRVDRRRLTLVPPTEKPISEESLRAAIADRGITVGRFTEEVRVRGRHAVFFEIATAEHRFGDKRGDWIDIYKRQRLFGWRAVGAMSLGVLLESESADADSSR